MAVRRKSFTRLADAPDVRTLLLETFRRRLVVRPDADGYYGPKIEALAKHEPLVLPGFYVTEYEPSLRGWNGYVRVEPDGRVTRVALDEVRG